MNWGAAILFFGCIAAGVLADPVVILITVGVFALNFLVLWVIERISGLGI